MYSRSLQLDNFQKTINYIVTNELKKNKTQRKKAMKRKYGWAATLSAKSRGYESSVE